MWGNNSRHLQSPLWVEGINTTGCCWCPKEIVDDTAITIPVSCSPRHDALHHGLGGPMPLLAVYRRYPPPRSGRQKLALERFRIVTLHVSYGCETSSLIPNDQTYFVCSACALSSTCDVSENSLQGKPSYIRKVLFPPCNVPLIIARPQATLHRL